MRARAGDGGERGQDVELFLGVGPEVERLVDLVVQLGLRPATEDVDELHVVLLRLEVLDPCGEAARETEHRGALEVAPLHAPVVGRLIDHRERQWMIEVLIVELHAPFEGARLAERRAQRHGAARSVIAPCGAQGDGRGVGPSWILLELVTRLRAGEILVVADLAHVEP